ncbi:MAG: tetratricopeptide repeat protein, partial [Anaerolineae bacterium]|nr:tetratricopeptide repeat protein [Anaerolineae bacterium]
TYALNGLGNAACLQGNLVQAEKQLLRALELARKHRSDYETGLCHTSLGILAGKQQDLVTARRHLDQSVACFQPGGFQRELAVAFL